MGTDEERGYRPVRDYALIGDAHTAALVSGDGAVDWCCWPRFDSPAIFCRLLDARKGGFFQIRPVQSFEAARAYSGPTAVLATTFSNGDGRVRLTDFMPVERLTEGHRGEDIASGQSILRLVEGLAGSVEVELSFRPTFDYARARADITLREGGAVARCGAETLVLSCLVQLTLDDDGTVRGRLRVSEGERLWVTLCYYADSAKVEAGLAPPGGERELERTVEYWRAWWSDCRYEGPYRDLVRRSALTLKLLTYEPTGALVAAPTTSLPEEVGGVRNWDYRYTWLRDSSLILYALQLLGYEEEAADFFGWLDKLCITCRDHQLQIMYTIDGKSHLPERTLDHLEGYRKSRPVRVGNAAFDQMQLDVYGEVLDAAHLYQERTRQPVRAEWWDELSFMADETARRWREPDHGIWEVRGGKRHFVHSKLMCWVALDRAVRLGVGRDTARWARARDDIQRAIVNEGYNEGVGAFTQSFGGRALDASALVIPLTGFLPATDPRVLSTVERIRERLTSRGLVYRYLTEDGLPGDEATFAMCSFWLADNLALQGRVDEARELFERLAGYASDTGLFAEEIDPATGELLGNYPQGFTHLALVRSALHIAKAESQGSEEHAETTAERAGKVERAESAFDIKGI
ncbi:MAG: glycoside hydrolase family 15 protein [Acidobacteriota bacterium]|nr:glycoside hydrolase family 15 protein [Acidobacteriota bacterium]